MATKFVEWEVPELDTLQDSKVYRLRHKLNNGGKMNREEKDWLTHHVNFNTYFTTAVPLMGWKFDFSDVLRPYLVCQYGKWSEYQAADKTALRNVIYGRIDNIVELQNGNRQRQQQWTSDRRHTTWRWRYAPSSCRRSFGSSASFGASSERL